MKCKITPLKQIFDERGKGHTCLEDFPLPGLEKYIFHTHPGVVKAWHLHKEMTLNYAVIFGEIKFVLYDDRPDSSTKGKIQGFFISPENYMLVTVPPLIWNGFKSVGVSSSIVANCATLPHSPDELVRKPPSDESIPYDWMIKHR